MSTAGNAPTLLVYLHGFRSSPHSFKALRLQQWLGRHRSDVDWWCPQLPPSPAAAMALVQQGLAERAAARPALLGSSLGGYYAAWLAERLACRAVLINPAIDPARDLTPYVGEQTAFHDPSQRFDFEARFLDELRGLRVGPPSDPARVLAVIAKGDEVLDWREMAGRYAGCAMRLIEGGDHGLSDFDDHLPTILRFLGLQP